MTLDTHRTRKPPPHTAVAVTAELGLILGRCMSDGEAMLAQHGQKVEPGSVEMRRIGREMTSPGIHKRMKKVGGIRSLGVMNEVIDWLNIRSCGKVVN